MSYQLSMRQIEYFLTVAEELHFAKAAQRLFISQPGISRQVKFMEEALGIQLFERDNRNVKLTEAGTFLQEELQLLMQGIDNSIYHAKLIHEGNMGRLKLGYVGSAMQNIIPDLLLKIRQAYPNIQFNLKELDNHFQISQLLAQEIDLGFLRMDRGPRDLNIQPIFEDTFSLVLPAKHPLSSENFISLKQVQNEPFILFERAYSPSYYEKMRQIFDYVGFTPIVAHNTVHASTIYKLVENNFGISIVPTSLQSGYDMQVKFIELADIPQRTTLSIAWNKKNRNPLLQKVLAFVG